MIIAKAEELANRLQDAINHEQMSSLFSDEGRKAYIANTRTRVNQVLTRISELSGIKTWGVPT